MPITNAESKRIAKLYNDRIAWMMKEQQFGRRCKFIYPPIKTQCPNCLIGAGGLSNGIYRRGGPRPFHDNTTCPVCLGQGTFEEHTSEEDIMIVLFDANQWFEPGKVASMPDNSAMIIGDRKRTWGKVVRCERVILNTDVYSEGTPYKRHGEPYPVGLFNADNQGGSKWFYCYFTREGGG